MKFTGYWFDTDNIRYDLVFCYPSLDAVRQMMYEMARLMNVTLKRGIIR